MTGDTFDRFQPADRGRFGDNEGDFRSSSSDGRRSGAADTVDLNMVHHLDAERPSAVFVSLASRSEGVWLPKSLIKMTTVGAPVRKNRGLIDQPVLVTLPRWKAEQAGLA